MGVWIMLCAEVDLSRYGRGGGPFPFYNQPRRLVREGIYSCTRNPTYLGTTVEYCGVGLLMDELFMLPAALLVLSLALTLYSVYEKPRLVKLFGEEARTYISHIPLLIPRFRCVRSYVENRCKESVR
ncbi:MAG: methyltransferase [Nitrososphaerales archaeon]